MIKPKALKKNATIGIISPASPMRDEDKLNRGIRYLESLGYRVELGRHVGAREHYLAGSDAQRADDIMSMFSNPTIDAIFCTRGGYGVMRLLDRLRYSVIRRHPKIFVGFSDMTALNCALWKKCGLVSFSGAMVGVDMHDFDAESEEQFWRMLTVRRKPGMIKQSTARVSLTSGRARGRLVCGNLSILSALSGTRYAPLYKDALLLCEDIGEESYKVDRLLCQLELSGALSQSSGLLFGHFTQDVSRTTQTPSRPMDDVLREYAMRNDKCAIANIMYGHTSKKLTLPFGVACHMDAGKGRFSLDEAGVE